jgi:putative flippase GtrA
MSIERNFAGVAVRWLKFNAVGAMGIVVQLVTLAALRSGFGIGYLTATGLAVEAAVIHNYLWHERFTWADRETRNPLMRLLKFNLTTGMFSIGGNLLLMRLLVGELGMNYLAANLVTIATCSIVNFLVSDRVVFEG